MDFLKPRRKTIALKNTVHTPSLIRTRTMFLTQTLINTRRAQMDGLSLTNAAKYGRNAPLKNFIRF